MNQRLISNIQVSGLDRTGKTTLLRETLGFGNRVHHFPQPMLLRSPVATYHSLIQVMEEITAFPAKRDCLNSLTIWDRGLIDPFVYDAVRTRPTITIDLWKEFVDQFLAALMPTRPVFMIFHEPFRGVDAKDEEDATMTPFEGVIRERFLAAADYLTLWGCEVHVIPNAADARAVSILHDHFLHGETIGIGHQVEGTRIILGKAV